ncbi:MAG TPA: hypothetical protein VJ964_18060 [Balneolaceae bacterium]|nr:hypothetical protein [Balneolaceae bacterium]
MDHKGDILNLRITVRIVSICTTALLIALIVNYPANAQTDTVSINIDVSQTIGNMDPVWAYWGYDEPNYTYMHDGKKLLSEMSDLSPVPVYVRAHNILNTGNGKPALKWGSTNIYTKDKNGNLKYDWTIVDRIFDAYVNRGMKPMVEIGFMPKALSSHPEPYRHHWSPDQPYENIYTGWSYPPKSYEKWADLINRWVKHCIERYGKEEVKSWWWEVWNEPNIDYWQGTEQQYFKLYDYTVNAVLKALPDAKVGGPATTGPGWDQAAGWLRDFLKHCQNDKNAVTGKTGAPLDFISYHAKGAPDVVNGHVQMNMGSELNDVEKGFQIVSSSPYKDLPIIISEADPEGCAACSMELHPQNAYRNGTMYSSYTASVFAKMYQLADQYNVNLEGALSWSFEFENEDWFAGFRSMATNGVDKPVLNVFRMFGMMQGKRIAVNRKNAITPQQVITSGVHGQKPDINALASKSDQAIYVMVWNYHDDHLPGPEAPVNIELKNVAEKKMLLEQYRIDEYHSNAYTKWREMGAPQQVTAQQYKKIEQAGQLESFGSPEWIHPTDDKATISLMLPRHGVSLFKLSW